MNTPRFRTYRGRVMGADTANLSSVGCAVPKRDSTTSTKHATLDSFPSAGTEKALNLYSGSIQVATAGTDVFVGGQFPTSLWKAGDWDDDDTTDKFTDDTTDAQDAGTNDFYLHGNPASPAQNDGFIVAAKRKFNCLVVNVSTAGASTTTDCTDELTYWNGSSWSSLHPYLVVCPTLNTNGSISTGDLFADTGDTIIIFSPPSDWAAITSSTRPSTTAVGGQLDEYYAIRYRQTDSDIPGTIGKAAQLFVGYVRATFWNISTYMNSVDLSLPLTSTDEAPWVLFSNNGTSTARHQVIFQVEQNNFNGKIGE